MGSRYAFDDLVSVMARLRRPGGCPWDRAQTPRTLRPYLLEEMHEVLEAIDRGDQPALREELGDLLLQVVFHARMREEEGAFRAGGVGAGQALPYATLKCVGRFARVEALTAASGRPLREHSLDELLALWQQAKSGHAGGKGPDGHPA